VAWIATLVSALFQGGKAVLDWLQRRDLKRQGAQDWLGEAHERRKKELEFLEDRAKIAAQLRRYRVRRLGDPGADRLRQPHDPPDET